MAELKSSVLGEVRGKIGNELFRKINGKIFISEITGKYTTSQLPHEIDKRSRQKVNGKFGSVILKSSLLKAIWEKEKAPCTRANNKINKVNFAFCEPGRPSEKAQITPGGFKLEAEEISVLPGRIEVAPLPFALHKEETKVIFILILSLWNKRRKKDDDFKFLLMQETLAEVPRLTFKLSKEETSLIKKYKNKTIYLAAVTLE